MAFDRSRMTKEQRIMAAKLLAADRLPRINQMVKPAKPRSSFYTKYVKRLIDIVISLIALIVTLPINLVIGIITYFDVGSPIFFRQERVGKDGKTFQLVKFRNMKNTCDERGELLPASQRVTKFGKFVRKTSLDELLNFWFILKGDMSLIGPRPLVPDYYYRWNDRHKAFLAVRPGLECPPPVGSTSRTWQDQFEENVWYAENISFKTDLLMCWRLVKFAFNRKSAEKRANVGKGNFMGYSEDGTAIVFEEVPESYLVEAVRLVEEEHRRRQEQSGTAAGK